MHHIQKGQWANQTVAAAYLGSGVDTLIRYRKENILEEGTDWVKKGDSQTSAVIYNLETCKLKLKEHRKYINKKRADRMSKMMHKKHNINNHSIVEVDSIDRIAEVAKVTANNQDKPFNLILNLDEEEFKALVKMTKSSEKKVVLNGIELVYSQVKEEPSYVEIATVAKALMKLGIDMIGSKE